MSGRFEDQGSILCGLPNAPSVFSTTAEMKPGNDFFPLLGGPFDMYRHPSMFYGTTTSFDSFEKTFVLHEEEDFSDLSKIVEVDLQSDSVFAFNSMEYAHIFSDIRCDQQEHDVFDDSSRFFLNETVDRDESSPLFMEQGSVTTNETSLPNSSPARKSQEKAAKDRQFPNSTTGSPSQIMREEDRKQLEGFSLKNRLTSVEDLTGKVVALSKDQNGCRYLQTLLEGQPNEYLNLIAKEVISFASELMVDPFGNYLCQKIIDRCGDEQRTLLINQVSHSLEAISSNNHGTRAVQKLLDAINNPTQIQMIANALKGHVVTLITDLNGNHVIQRFLHKFSPADCQFIYDDVTANLVHVATQRYGCCVLQRCIDHANPVQRKSLVEQIGANALQLVQDQFGNYVVQYALDSCPPNEHSVIISKFVGSVTQLSTQKFSSNVMEKCLEIADSHIQIQFLKEISHEKNVQILLSDPFGNYVLQRALGLADESLFNELCSKIRPLLPTLRTTACGKRICNKLLKLFPAFSDQHNTHPGYAYQPQFGEQQFQKQQELSLPRYSHSFPHQVLSPSVGIHNYSGFPSSSPFM